MRALTITRPDDWHLHLRDEDVLKHTVPATSKHFARALVMPNLKPPLTSLEAIVSYRERILAVLESTDDFQPFMTFYLNESVNPADLQQAKNYPFILGAKLYPAGATTNSEQGVRSIKALYPLLESMQENNLVLQIHGETTHGDIFGREASFISEWLTVLLRDFPTLRIVLEHISSREAVDFVKDAPARLTATITPHHLLYNRNHLLVGGIKPHLYCLPILKAETDQIALQHAAVSGNNKFFAGTDSAPHAQDTKENACGCAGIFSAPFAVAMYAEVFSQMDQLQRLDAFLSHFGADFYQLPRITESIELIEKPQFIPDSLPFGEAKVIPAGAGQTLTWSIHE